MDTKTIERELERLAGVQAVVEESEGELVVSGVVQTDGERQAALDVVQSLCGDLQVVDDLEVESGVPDEIGQLSLADVPGGDFPETLTATSDSEALEPGDFSDQEILENPAGASGPGDTAVDEDLSEGEAAYVPPTDPPRSPDNEFLGGFQATSMDTSAPAAGDESLKDSILRELIEDSTTTGLELDVEVQDGVARLRGKVGDMDDLDNALAVAERVPGVIEVVDEIEVANL